MEIWKDIEGYEGIYQVSSEGRVKSLNFNKVKVILPTKVKGYPQVGLHKNGKQKIFRVHRLVAEAFIENPDNKPYTDHINGIRDDNRAINLRWCSAQENMSFPLAKKHMREGRKDKKQVYQYTLDKELVAIWPSTQEAARNGYNQGAVSACCRGVYGNNGNIYKGFIFSYVPL